MGSFISSGRGTKTKSFGCRISAELQDDLNRLRDRARTYGERLDIAGAVNRALRALVTKGNSELNAREQAEVGHDGGGDDSVESVDQHSHAAIPDHDADTP